MDNIVQQIKAELKKLKQERAAIEQKVRALETALNAYSEREAVNKREPLKINSKGQSRATKIVEILELAGTPMHYKEIVKKLQETEGSKINDKTITATLSTNKDRFIRVDRGKYDLVDKKAKE